MKNRLIFLSGVFTLTIISTELFSQSLTLVGDTKLSLKEDGLVVSAPSVKLNDNSQISQFEGIKLTQSEFIQLLSPNALLITKILQNNENVILPVGIQSKTLLTLQNHGPSVVYQIGMNQNPDSDALPFVWVIDALSEEGKPNATVGFAWEKEEEPENFSLKALVKKEGADWDLLLDQQVEESMISLSGLSEFEVGGSVFTVKNFVRDLDEDEVPDIREIQTDSDLNDPGSYLDSDRDGVPDYLEDINGTDPSDPLDFLDENKDGISDYLAWRSPVAFLDLTDVSFPWGLENFIPLFQDSVFTMLGSGKMLNLPVNWDGSQVNVLARGIYPLPGQLTLPRGVFNAFNSSPNVNGIVLPKPSPLNILLTDQQFIGENDIFFIQVGSFIVDDPIDQIHKIELLGLGYDNPYFEIRENVLYWSSEDRAEGKTTFTIIVRVTDRDGNTLDKFFEISRIRLGINEMEVFNAFTPDGDGVNDTWGVPEIRFYRGARVQVFERSGERVFYTEDPDVRWNGTYKGKEMPTGAYTWVIEVIETGENRMGVLNLIRN